MAEEVEETVVSDKEEKTGNEQSEEDMNGEGSERGRGTGSERETRLGGGDEENRVTGTGSNVRDVKKEGEEMKEEEKKEEEKKEEEKKEEDDDDDDMVMPLFEINIEEYVLEAPLLHLTLYQQGPITGIIGYNPQNREISFLQEKNLDLQKSFNQSIRFLNKVEKVMFIKLYLSSVRYSRIMNRITRVFHDALSFVNPNDEPDEAQTLDIDLDAVKDIQESSFSTFAKESSFSSFAKESLSKKSIYRR